MNMKVGAEDKKKVYIMGALLAVAILLLLRTFFFSSGTPASANVSTSPAAARAAKGPNLTLDPTLRADLLRNSEGAEYRGSGRNIFEEQATPLPKPKTPIVV